MHLPGRALLDIICSDETGHVAIGQEVLNTGLLLLLASLDGPLPFVDFMISAYLTATFLHEVTAGREKEEVKSEAITVNPDRKQAYFTESPYAKVHMLLYLGA